MSPQTQLETRLLNVCVMTHTDLNVVVGLLELYSAAQRCLLWLLSNDDVLLMQTHCSLVTWRVSRPIKYTDYLSWYMFFSPTCLVKITSTPVTSGVFWLHIFCYKDHIGMKCCVWMRHNVRHKNWIKVRLLKMRCLLFHCKVHCWCVLQEIMSQNYLNVELRLNNLSSENLSTFSRWVIKLGNIFQ